MHAAQRNELILCEQWITSFGGALKRPSLQYPPFAMKRGQNPRNQVNLVNKQVHTKLAQKICEVLLCIRLTIYDLLPNRKWVWRERGSLLFTDIFVRIISERHTNLCLLPLDLSLR